MIGERPLKTAIVRKLNADFNHTKIPGLTAIPTVIQDRPLAGLPQPYIYVEIAPGQVREVDVTKSGSSFEYLVNVQVVTKSQTNQDSKAQRDLIISEVQNVLDTDNGGGYLDLSTEGYNVYVQNAIRVQPGETLGVGADYFFSTLVLAVRMQFVGTPESTEPVQAPSFTYSLFRFDPSATGHIERYDAGVITPATTYPSSNNGWDFLDASYSISLGAGGTFANGDYDVPVGADPVRLDSSLRYEFSSDTTILTTLSATTDFLVIDSIRYGGITPQTPGTLPTLSDDTAATYGLRNLSNWNIEYGTVRPHGETITVTGDENQYVYIIIDHEVTLTQIRNTLGQNVIAQFDVQTLGDYKIYLNTNPIVFDGFSTDFTLIA